MLADEKIYPPCNARHLTGPLDNGHDFPCAVVRAHPPTIADGFLEFLRKVRPSPIEVGGILRDELSRAPALVAESLKKFSIRLGQLLQNVRQHCSIRCTLDRLSE